MQLCTLINKFVIRDEENVNVYQNVLGICDFDLIFTFIWAGWEGVAHDSRVLKEVAFNLTSGFPFPSPGLISFYNFCYLYIYIISVTLLYQNSYIKKIRIHLQINITCVTLHIPTLVDLWLPTVILGIG